MGEVTFGTWAWAVARRTRHGYEVMAETVRRTRQEAITAYVERNCIGRARVQYDRDRQRGDVRCVEVLVRPTPTGGESDGE